ALRPLMNGKIAADAMTGAVRIIEPRFPQRPPGEAVQLRPARAFREDGRGDGNVALQNTREAVAHFVGRLADRDGPSDIRRPVDILAARIDQIELAALKLAVGLLARLVMDDRAVRARTGD